MTLTFSVEKMFRDNFVTLAISGEEKFRDNFVTLAIAVEERFRDMRLLWPCSGAAAEPSLCSKRIVTLRVGDPALPLVAICA